MLPIRTRQTYFFICACGSLLVLVSLLLTRNAHRRVPTSALFDKSLEEAMLKGGLWPPFQAGAKKVLLLSYQRTGSTFIGASLFNNNPEVFYIYEPLDGTYASLYGTSDGWNIPDEIMAYANGSLRTPPLHELQAVRDTLNKLFTCNIKALSTRVISHAFWRYFHGEMTQTSRYTRCVRQKNRLVSFTLYGDLCSEQIREICQLRFNTSNPFLDSCYTAVHKQDPDRAIQIAMKVSHSTISRENITKSFKNYKACLNHVSLGLDTCRRFLNHECQSKSLRAIKTVRATMESVGPLLQKDPNLRVIHLFRDPRGAVLSKSKLAWAQGSFAGKNLSLEARVYCQSILKDLSLRKQLESRHPGRIVQLTYEEFIAAPMLALYKIYDFLETPISPEVVKSLQATSKTSVEKALKWQQIYNQSDIDAIDNECWQLYRATSFG